MKKNLFFASLMALGMSLGMVSCGDDNGSSSSGNNGGATSEEIEAQNTDYTSENADAWGNYAYNVALLLQSDATRLYKEWNEGFADDFKNQASGSGYTSPKSCVEEIFAGCANIANEVGTAKIGEPVDYWNAGLRNKALYAVESWYSWHSRDDYKNNILSIANSFLGTRIKLGDSEKLTAAVASKANNNSLYKICSGKPALEVKTQDVLNNICTAWQAIDNIPQPFRNNIGSTEAQTAMAACSNLEKSLDALKAAVIAENSPVSEAEMQAVVAQFVDGVVLPTYEELKNEVDDLTEKVIQFKNNPTNGNFETLAAQWLEARAPWESSEAFLFGPVDELGLDPNMDSWPLDPVGIVNLLKSANWKQMEWKDGDSDEAIEEAQSRRGFHTLEFLIFKNGQARKVN
jgi:predicted lipoprotein